MSNKSTVLDVTLKDVVCVINRDGIGCGDDLTNGKDYAIISIYAESDEVYPSIAVVDDVGEEIYILESEFSSIIFKEAVAE